VRVDAGMSAEGQIDSEQGSRENEHFNNFVIDGVVAPRYKRWSNHTEAMMSINQKNRSPKEMEILCGFGPAMLKEWRRLKLLDHIGEVLSNGHWKYSVREAVILSLCNSFRLAGLPGHVAIKVASDIVEDVLKTVGFYGVNTKPNFSLIAIWNEDATPDGSKNLLPRYYPWDCYEANDWQEIYHFIKAPAPIVADLHKLSTAFSKSLVAALRDEMAGVKH